MKKFTLRSLLILVTLICTWLGWRYTNQRLRHRDVCREMVSAVLKSEHALAFDRDGTFQQEMSTLFETLEQGRPYVADFIKPDGTLKSGKAISSYEEDLVARLASAKTASAPDAFYEVQQGMTYRYYQPIWNGPQCSVCHSRGGSLLAIVRVELQP